MTDVTTDDIDSADDLSGLSGAATATGDKFAIWDVSAQAWKSITRAELKIALEAAGLVGEDGNGDATVTRDLAVTRYLSSAGARVGTAPSLWQPLTTSQGMTVVEVAGGSDEKNWDKFISGGLMAARLIKDDYSAANFYYTVTRSGYTVTQQSWYIGSSTEVVRINGSGYPHFIGARTTASAANAFLDSGSTPANELLRSTSSEIYKRDIEPLDPAVADRIVQEARPIWYRSRAEHDRADWSWYGLSAEQMAAIDPRLVQYGYQDRHWERVEVEPAREVEVGQADGSVRTVSQPARYEMRVKEGAEKVPDGVAYERLTVILLDVARRQGERIAALEARLPAEAA